MVQHVYKNSTELMQLHGVPFYLEDFAKACLYGKLNLFLQGNSGEGKTQLAQDMRSYFGDNSLFILGRNDMDTRDLFQQMNPDFFKAIKNGTLERGASPKELTDKIKANLMVVDELPNCVPAVRAQLFNLFDGFIELNGQTYPIGNGYSVGIATGNIGQKFTESANELGRALKDRMHVIVDTDYFYPQPKDTLEILSTNQNPRVEFSSSSKNDFREVIAQHQKITSSEVPLEKLLVANYFLHGLDYCSKGSKRRMKERWPNDLENNETGSDIALVLPCSTRAAKSILRLSQSLDAIALEKGASSETIDSNAFNSMMQAYKFVSSYSGVFNDAMVESKHEGNKYLAADAVIATTNQQFDEKTPSISAGLELAFQGKTSKKAMDSFTKRWEFMKSILEEIAQKNKK